MGRPGGVRDGTIARNSGVFYAFLGIALGSSLFGIGTSLLFACYLTFHIAIEDKDQ